LNRKFPRGFERKKKGKKESMYNWMGKNKRNSGNESEEKKESKVRGRWGGALLLKRRESMRGESEN
jgi:hypothetical protein